MASGPALYVVRVEHRVSSLQLLCQQAIASALRDDKDVSKLALPPRLCSYLSTAFIPTIKVGPAPGFRAGTPPRRLRPRVPPPPPSARESPHVTDASFLAARAAFRAWWPRPPDARAVCRVRS